METLLILGADEKTVTFTLPEGEPVPVPIRSLHYEFRGSLIRRVRYGDFPITVKARLAPEGDLADRLPDSYHGWVLPPPPPFKRLDFRPITRGSDRVFCSVSVEFPYPYNRTEWIRAGAANLDMREGTATLKAYLTAGITDFEHDSSYAFNMDLIGLRFLHCWYGVSWFEAYLHPDIENFHLPDGDYNPAEHPDAWICDQCETPHPMLPDGFFVPKTSEENQKLFKVIRSRKLLIKTGPAFPKEEE